MRAATDVRFIARHCGCSHTPSHLLTPHYWIDSRRPSDLRVATLSSEMGHVQKHPRAERVCVHVCDSGDHAELL